MTAETQTRAGFAAVIGAPNAGKSTLVNALVGQKVSIVTHKVQTTRFPVRGVAMHGDAQIVLVDTPGVFAPRRRLDRAMVKAAWAGAEDADAVVHVVDAPAHEAVMKGGGSGADRRSFEDDKRVIEGLKHSDRKAILALNKIDALPRERLLALSQKLFDTGAYSEIFMLSAKRGDGVEDLKARLAALMPKGAWLYPPDQAGDIPLRLMAAEVTREKLYLRLHDELPYAATVETEAWAERKDGSVKVDQVIYVEREGYKPIVLGKGGAVIKKIGELARAELETMLERRVHLFLHVIVKPGWAEERARYSAVGLDYDG